MESDWQHACATILVANLHLLNSKKFTDVTFVVGEDKEVIDAHKLILMARSPVFEAMFERWETGMNSKIEVPEVCGESFQMFLKFLYADEFVVTGNEAVEVLYLAHKYDTKELASKCSDLLKSAMDINNVIRIHQVATKFEQKALQTQSMEFIFRRGKQVLEDIGFMQLDLDTLRSILQNDKLVSDELTIFQAVMRWAENKCDVQENTVVNKRIVLKDVIHLIRFPLMSSQEFTDEVVAKYPGILSDSEAVGIYIHITSGSPVQSGVQELGFSKTRRLSGIVYTVNPYKNSGYLNASCCQYPLHGSRCQATLQFYTNWNIRVTAIELFEQIPGIPQFSVSVYQYNQPMATITLANLRPNSSTVFELNNGGIDVPKNVCYFVKVECDGGQYHFLDHPTMNLVGSIQATGGKESITFSFLPSSGICAHNGGYCICSGKIKAIHFTI